MSLRVTGAKQLSKLAADLRRAGSPGARGIRRKLGRNLRAAVEPMKVSAQANARALPTSGMKDTGLRDAIANATRIRVLTGGRNPVVRLQVMPSRMPTGQQRLPLLMEGDGVRWRHPVYGHGVWVTQPSHSYFRPAVAEHLAGVQRAAVAAVNETAAEIEGGI